MVSDLCKSIINLLHESNPFLDIDDLWAIQQEIHNQMKVWLLKNRGA